MNTALKQSFYEEVYKESYTSAQYLALESESETKHEYHNGHIVAMTRASFEHNRIIVNLATELTNGLRSQKSSCGAFVNDLRVYIPHRNMYTYPDVLVLCNSPEFVEGRKDTITNPNIIIEVLSASTEAYDRSKKFHAY